MPQRSRPMRLTARHVAYLQPAEVSEQLSSPPAHMRAASEADHRATIDALMAQIDDPGEIWLFAYGSLIWQPACDFVEMRTGTVRGWHRAFCFGWLKTWRASDAAPGLMLALDRGGACKGVAYRLPPDRIEENLIKLLNREMGWLPSPFPPRWVKVQSGERNITALTFCIDRNSGFYVSGLSEPEIADVLAQAVGTRGSMADYLHATVSHLEQMGIHDAHLWKLQSMVADRIEAAFEPDR